MTSVDGQTVCTIKKEKSSRSLFIAIAVLALRSVAHADAFSWPCSPVRPLLQSSQEESRRHALSSTAYCMLPASSGESDFSSDSSAEDALFDKMAFEKRNSARKKFGVPPLTPEQFLEVNAQIRQMEIFQEQKAEERMAIAAAAALASKKRQQKEKRNFLKKMMGGALEDTCQSNFDCERPQVCCDLGFKKMCCSSGMGIFEDEIVGKLERIPVRVVAGGSAAVYSAT